MLFYRRKNSIRNEQYRTQATIMFASSLLSLTMPKLYKFLFPLPPSVYSRTLSISTDPYSGCVISVMFSCYIISNCMYSSQLMHWACMCNILMDFHWCDGKSPQRCTQKSTMFSKMCTSMKNIPSAAVAVCLQHIIILTDMKWMIDRGIWGETVHRHKSTRTTYSDINTTFIVLNG